MSRIQLLSEEVASQVAAGEVVERPASVVKELVENSLDAGARRIEVMMRRGGISLIRVVDDGCGMDRDDALLCLERHATSKIRTGADLAAIRTLGFRGEALPSIASVARFRLSTRMRDAVAGTEIMVTGGKIDYVRDGGDAPGTQIEVRSLFFNLPARRKFLRTENTEASHVEHQLQLQALGHPEVGFVLLTDDRTVFQLPPATNLRDRIRDLSGRALADELLEVPEIAFHGMTIRGFVGKPGVSRSSRAQQIVFVNGRPVENATLNHGLREGYHTALMKGQYPVTFLFLEMDPAAVDVNVHPAKREVRFREPSAVREALVEAIQRTLEGDRAQWSGAFAAPGIKLESPVPEEPAPLSLPGMAEFHAPQAPILPLGLTQQFQEPYVSVTMPEDGNEPLQQPPAVRTPMSPAPVAVPPPEPAPKQRFRLLGVLGKLYVVMENAGGLVLVDQHAAHERILFEELRRRMEELGVPSQRLLMPLTLQLGPRDSDWVEQNLETLQKMGIGVEGFGSGTWKLDSIPQFVRSEEPQQLLRDIIDELREVSSQSSKLRLGEDVIAKTVCRHAVKANDLLREPELIRLIEDLLQCDLPYCCPHGRPTMIQISYLELEKKFGRKA
ncbi:MAG: DNA mismatch repair endonuclease MutL [Verrucomicrobia bacterium]|nr:DNA mismatch repair endonuclease MutL [Verrucomicrobiota bacterium]